MPSRIATMASSVLLASCMSMALPRAPSPTGASSTPGTSSPTATPFSPGSVPPTTSDTAAPTTSSGAGLQVSSGHGWSLAGLDGPVPGPGTCHYRQAADGYLLPDPVCTPGAVDPAVGQSTLGVTICRPGGYTSTVRPPQALTEPFKVSDEAAYGDPAPGSETELDHLVPLELGGSSDTRNLWAEPDQGSPAQFDPADPFGRNAKDGVENRLHDAVCNGQVSLSAAQRAIATDWTTAIARLGLSG
jgi:hypothetical protein